MRCPHDDAELVVSTRSGVEIDSCPQCRGVWLDRGELDKLIAAVDVSRHPRRPPSMRPFTITVRRASSPTSEGRGTGADADRPERLGDYFD